VLQINAAQYQYYQRLTTQESYFWSIYILRSDYCLVSRKKKQIFWLAGSASLCKPSTPSKKGKTVNWIFTLSS